MNRTGTAGIGSGGSVIGCRITDCSSSTWG
jgi:hypothetical protein